MFIKPISRKEGRSFNLVFGERPLFGIDKFWYSNKGNIIIGTIYEDQCDLNWNYIIRILDADGLYRAIKGERAIESVDIAQEKLIGKMNFLCEKREFEENLFLDESHGTKLKSAQIMNLIFAQAINNYFKKKKHKIDNLSSIKFEKIVVRLVENMGFSTFVIKIVKDEIEKDEIIDVIVRINFKLSFSFYLTYFEFKRKGKGFEINVSLIEEAVVVHKINKSSKNIVLKMSRCSLNLIMGMNIMKNQINFKNYLDLKDCCYLEL
jgi:hypothetical protein